MPIVITPTGQFVDSATGNPVNLPPQRMGEMAQENIPANRDMGMDSMMPQTMTPVMRPTGVGATSDAELKMMEEMQSGAGSMSDAEMMAMRNREAMNMQNNMSGAMSDQEAMAMQQGQIPAMSIEEKLDILMRMGLSQDEAIEAIALENSLPATNPSEFGGARSEGEMGALSGVPTEARMPTSMPRPMPRPNSLEQMRMEGRDRSFNPMDSIRPDNTPNT